MSPALPLIALDAVTVSRGRRPVLDIAELQIDPGQVLALSGANGAGKTTLLKLLAGLLVADRGTLACLGTPLAPHAAARYCRGRHVYLHQTPYMFEGSVEDNVAYGLVARVRDFAARRIEIRAALTWAELGALATRRAKTLSLGEQQRVALTRAKVLAPALLLLDEITANLDADNRRRIYALIADLKRAGTSVVFASHDPEPVAAHADLHLELVDGHLQRYAPYTSAVVPLRPPGHPERHESR